MKKYLSECIGSFFLVLTFILTANNPNLSSVMPLAVGAMYAAMIYAGAKSSGAHYNPAVTLAQLMRGNISTTDAAPYVLAQLGGALLASIMGVFFHRSTGGIEIVSVHNQSFPALLGELLGTFALCYVILNTAEEENRLVQGLTAGLTLSACLYALGNLSGGAFNPAIAVGFSISGMKVWGELWIFLAGGFGGAAIAATLRKLTME